MFTRRQIIALLIPLVLEQVLTGLMGIADTMMVTSVGDAAISAVSLVDSINPLVLNLLSALSAGGAIVCAQYLGRRDRAKANDAARQLMVLSIAVSLVIMVACLALRRPMLFLIFGTVEPAVMEQAITYLIITGISYPFVAAQQSAAAVFRATGNSTPPMVVAAVANMINVAGNAITIFCFDMGVSGAAWATTVSRVFSAVVLMVLLRSNHLEISVRDYHTIRLERSLMRSVLGVGIPVGIENSMFQFGKIMVQSTVSTLGTAAMAAQAMIQMLDMFQAMPVLAISTGLLTVAGQCMGAGRVDEMKMYTRKFCIYSEVITVVNSFLMQFQADILGKPVDVPVVTEMTPYGAAFLAALAVGEFNSIEDVRGCWQLARRYEPQMSEDERQFRLERWHKAVELSKGWAIPGRG